MSSETKYKVWSKELKQMFWLDVKWGRNGRSGAGWISAVPVGVELKAGAYVNDNTIDLSPDECEFLQFTGLTDKNGIEVYEGDVIEFDEKEWGGNDNRWEVKWDSKKGAWDLGGGASHESERQFRSVVGDIFQNPELLQP